MVDSLKETGGIAMEDEMEGDRRALRECVAHFHTERNHHGVENRLLDPLATISSIDEPVQCSERIGGTLNFYYREVD